MGLKLHGIPAGIQILDINQDTGVSILQGSAIPGSIGTFDDEAAVGSLYLKQDGQTYQKKASGSGADKWRKLANADDLLNVSWRSDIVKALTSTTAPIEGGTIDLNASPFTDDDTPFLAGSDFSLGDAVLFGSGGTEEIHRVTNIAGDVLTFTKDAAHATYPVDPLVDNDAFLVRHYLPDSPDAQEKQALVMYNGSSYIKLGDVNWDIATGINLSGAYAASAGNVTSSDTVEGAIIKLDGNLDNTSSILGRNVQSDTHMGVYTSDILTDNQTAKTNIQELSSEIERQFKKAAITTIDTLDSLLVDNYLSCKWIITAYLDSNKAQKKVMEVMAVHNGTDAADATVTDYSITSKLRVGTPFNTSVTVDLSGALGAQVLRVRVAATAAVTFYARRVQAIKDI